ncbi:conserved hypothetical protein [Methylotenera versatilis 301]|uniref:Uncharacterized protein n=1 Tax=Methylotenera versatilis (strain 301) TaxID=666681 RepID=D7DMA7_METV0|nr:conserved hypothetical protein [Methylotenera versatilis 301]
MLSKIGHGLNQLVMVTSLAALTWLGWKVAHGHYYKPGVGLGYNLGLIGGLMMLTLLMYSFRKHIKFMQGLGKLKYWFRIHMILGVLGPVLVLFHTTFRLGSMNATIAFYCMVVVASSGLIGKFAYTRIHKGLYGSRSSLKEAREELAGSSDGVKSKLHFFPKVEKKITYFEYLALEKKRGFFEGLWFFLTFDVRRMYVAWQCKRYIYKIMAPKQMNDVAKEASSLVSQYLIQVQTVAQFKKFEQIFSAWHVLHIPLMYMMVASAIFHVIWVHMY